MKTLLHVNYYEGLGKLETLFKIAASNGCSGVELRRFSAYETDEQGYLNKIADLKQRYSDFEIIFGYPLNYMVDEPERIKTDEQNFIKFLDWAQAACGTKIINFFTGNLIAPGAEYTDYEKNGSACATEVHYERAAVGLRRLNPELAKRNMRIALESHNCYLHDLPQACAKLLDMADADRCGINYDHGNIFINHNGVGIDECFKLLNGRIYYAHLKNLMRTPDFKYNLATHLEDGHIDTCQVMKGLANELPDGIIAIEYPCSGDGVIAAKRDMDYIRFLQDFLAQ